MWHDDEFWRTLTLLVAAIGQTLFVALYVTFSWWKTFLGRALFFKSLALAVLIDIAFLGRTVNWPGEDVTFIALYGVLTVGVWAQLLAFLSVRRHKNSKNEFPETARERSDGSPL